VDFSFIHFSAKVWKEMKMKTELREKRCIHMSIKWENILELNNKQCKKEEKAF